MISAAKTTEPKGFTLIEVVMVLAIAGVIMGGAVGLMIYSSDERVLRDTSGEIELLAKRARTVSILQQTPYALEFREGTVRLLPYAQAGLDERKNGRRLGDAPMEDSEGLAANRQLRVDPGVIVSIRRWNSDTWLTTIKDNVHVWRFDPDGLCEPISVRMVYGDSWAEDTYHPLTATIRESLLEAR
jgi:prepilin-type N-terminal cleavage/methylation domain-containing protein